MSTLGEEILYTCHALYGKDQLYHVAKGLELLKLDTEVTKTFGPHILQLATAKPFVCPGFFSSLLDQVIDAFPTSHQVLSERTRKLRAEIERRRAWLPSLIRDIKKQAKTQPFLFYGGILAVFFGILQSIQTITSVWSLVLAIRAQ